MAKYDHDGVTDELRALLRGAKLRATGARLATLTQLHHRAQPLTHAELMGALEPAGWDRATIYRVLADLTDKGLLHRMDLGDHVWRFELVDACRPIAEEHAHFLCRDCGDVTCLPPLELRGAGGAPLPHKLRGAELQLKVTGRCAACAA